MSRLTSTSFEPTLLSNAKSGVWGEYTIAQDERGTMHRIMIVNGPGIMLLASVYVKRPMHSHLV